MSKSNFFGGLIKTNPTLPTGNSGANYGVASGVWNLEEALAFREAGDWPIPASAPGAPSIGTATAGNASVSVAFTANADDGGLTPTFTATSNPSSITGSASSSPITVSGLTNGTAYTFTVTATNSAGTSSASSASNSATPQVPDTALFYGGNGSLSPYANQSAIYERDITSLGNASGFGNLTTGALTYMASAASSSTRAVAGGGYNSSGQYKNDLQYMTYSSSGNSTDFGDLTQGRSMATGGGNSTRGLYYAGVLGPRSQVIDYITIASTGDATDFGDTLSYGQSGGATYADTTYFFHAAGDWGYTGGRIATVRRCTIATTGSETNWTALTESRENCQGASNSTYGIVGGGTNASAVNKIDRHTMSSSGSTTDFGDMTENRSAYACASNSTRVLFAGGNENASGNNNKIMYVTIASTGNTADFGTVATTHRWGGCSNAHGGL